MNKIDLHMHSHISDDGQYDVQTLLDIAKKSEVEIIAIADHNSTRAYEEIADTHGIKVIPAIEMDCTFQNKDFHVLGYGIDPEDKVFKKVEENVFLQEQEASKFRLDYVQNKMGLKLNYEILEKRGHDGIYVAETLCEAALACDENKNNPYLIEYYPGGKRSDNPLVNFFWDYFAKGKEAYTLVNFPSMKETIALYKAQNAKVVLAHPGNNVKEDSRLLEDIISLGIDGIEVYSSYHSDEQIKYYYEACKKNNLLMTCGSDFHGRTKPTVKMGKCNMPKEEEIILKDYLLKHIIK